MTDTCKLCVHFAELSNGDGFCSMPLPAWLEAHITEIPAALRIVQPDDDNDGDGCKAFWRCSSGEIVDMSGFFTDAERKAILG